AIVQQIDEAQKEIKIMIYSFTSDAIAQALLQALIRNVAVEIIIDEGNDKLRYSQTDLLRQNGIKVYIDGREIIHHNKVIIIDQEIVITGSFNFSKAAEQKNAENLIILKSAELASIYLANYELHKEHSYLVGAQNIEQIREKILFDIQEEQSSTQTELNYSATPEATTVRE
ncbi:MAG TPA: phospholipase D-like domain-containing protein, partial [Pseudothermotoga sp.]|nr:phospholipase D-like domain-containing protein [Pseudothermotoga sp.]